MWADGGLFIVIGALKSHWLNALFIRQGKPNGKLCIPRWMFLLVATLISLFHLPFLSFFSFLKNMFFLIHLRNFKYFISASRKKMFKRGLINLDCWYESSFLYLKARSRFMNISPKTLIAFRSCRLINLNLMENPFHNFAKTYFCL